MKPILVPPARHLRDHNALIERLNTLTRRVSSITLTLQASLPDPDDDTTIQVGRILNLRSAKTARIMLALVRAEGNICSHSDLTQVAPVRPHLRQNDHEALIKRSVQTHIRALRLSLSRLCMDDAIRSHYGHGYSIRLEYLSKLRSHLELDVALKTNHHAPVSPLIIGCVKWFDLKRGYGFIISERDKRDILIQGALLKSGTIEKGALVRCEVIATKGGWQAARVWDISGEELSNEKLLPERRVFVREGLLADTAGPFEVVVVRGIQSDRGFVFVERSCGTEAFAHVRTLRKGGIAEITLGVGLSLMARIAEGPKGPIVTAAAPFGLPLPSV